MKPSVYVVNEKDEVIGEIDRDSVDYNSDIYRVSAVWVTSSANEVLIAQRKLTKKKDPGLWGPSVAGTVEVGESYVENALKETTEELGIDNPNLKEIGKIRAVKPQNYFAMYYRAILDWQVEKFTPQEDEVEALKWVQIDELQKDIETNPQNYIASMKDGLNVLSLKIAEPTI